MTPRELPFPFQIWTRLSDPAESINCSDDYLTSAT